MSFKGFPPEAFAFYEGLEADNSKAYWSAHKKVFDSCVAGPMQELLDELEPAFGVAKMFRPYRDVRFSKDKSPYKTRQYAVVHLGGEHGASGIQGLYLGIDADGLHLGGGQYQASTEQARRMRAAIAEDLTGQELRKVLDALQRKGFEFGGEQLKRVPKPWDGAHARADLLRYKSLTAHFHHPVDALLNSPKVKAEVASRWKAMAPLNSWMAAHAGG
ncbi:MAG TPA: DUF2461 domain-containing protein [Frankiaceae bacterium]|jgi:uncharacterized protein (TIGR02453 family)|nr:DUF2461 domain-containing protein [Frankiaceae bacterium]